MPQAGLSHQIRFKDVNDTNDVGLPLLRQDDGTFAYSWALAPALAPDVEDKDVNYGEFRDDLQLTWSQNDWSRGGLQFYYDPEHPNKYGIAKAAWPMTTNEVSAGMAMREIPFGVKDGGAENGTKSEWTTSGVTWAIGQDNSNPYTGHRLYLGSAWSQNDYVEITITDATDQPASRWQGLTVLARARIRTNAAAGTFRLNIVESGGASTPTTNGAGVTTTSEYQDVFVNVTALQADTTSFKLQLERTDAGADASIRADTFQCFCVSDEMNSSYCGMLEMGADTLLAFTEQAVWKFNGDENYWMLQETFAQPITGVAVYDDRLYIGQGESTAYQYSDVADPTTFTASTLASTGKNANRFIVTQNVNGNYALAKTLNDDELYLATDPTNSGSWGSALDVGKDDYNITNVHQLADTIAVGKEDGLYEYLSLEADRLVNIFPDGKHLPSVDNFTRGVNHQGQFYTVVGENGFLRWNGQWWETLDHLIWSPGFSEIGSRIRALGTDGQRLFLLVEEPVAASVVKTCWLLALRERFDGNWDVHTLAQMPMTDAFDMIVSKATESTFTYLYISGEISGDDEGGAGLSREAIIYRIRLPSQTNSPRHSQEGDLALNVGEFITSWMDWNRPNVVKAFNKLTLLTEELTGSITITAAYQVDNETSFTNINSSDSTFNTSPSETISFNTGVTGRRIRLRFIFVGNLATSGVIKALHLEASWRPDRLKRWRVTCPLEDGARGLQGAVHLMPAQKILSTLKNLEAETSPITFSDIDGVDNNVHITQMGERMLSPATSEAGQGGARYKRVIDLELTEAF